MFFLKNLLSKQNLSLPKKNSDRVANANPKSLIPVGSVNPIEIAMPKRCRDSNKAENLVKIPKIRNEPKTSSNIPFIKTMLCADNPNLKTKSGTKPVQ